LVWLCTTISVLLFAEGIWRLADPGVGVDNVASSSFQGANFILFCVFGLCCLYWPEKPAPSASKDEEPAAGEKGVVGLDVETPAANGEGAERCKEEDAPGAKPPKRQITYLTNLKTFLTFIVVTHHTVGQFTRPVGAGLSTVAANFLSPDLQPKSSFLTGGSWFQSVDQAYFMATFFFISAYFCPRSLDRKGFKKFVIDKIVRLGGPFVLYSAFLGPLLFLMCQAYAGQPLSYSYNTGPTWFILWLLNFSIAYAVIAQFAPTLKLGMPHPFVLLAIGAALCGVFYGMTVALGGSAYAPTAWNYFGSMVFWAYGLAMYIPFFAAGVLAGRNDWLKGVEEMQTWVAWTLRVVCVGFWTLVFLMTAEYAIPIPSIEAKQWELVMNLIPPVYAVAMTLAIMQLFHQYFNAQSSLMRWAGPTAYIVYAIHFWPMNLVMITFIEIIKAAGVPVVFEGLVFFSTTADGERSLLPEACIWGGWVMLFVLTQLVVWPLGFYARKAPVLDMMF